VSAPGASKRLFISSRCAQTIFTQRLSLADYAVSQGWEVQLGGDVSSGNYAQRLSEAGFEFHALPVDQKSLNPLRLCWLVIVYYQILRRSQPLVFHAFTIKPLICGLIGARLAGVPVRIATVPGLGHAFISSTKWVSVIAALLFRIAFRFADIVIFYNREDRDEFIKRNLVSAEKARLIPGSGLNLSRFQVAQMPANELTQIVFVGRLLREKGVLELLEAMRILHRKNIKASLHLVGDCDPNNPSALPREVVDEAVSEGLVTWHGLVTDVRPLIAAAHMVILPSYREGIPLALLEGAAMGRALIATDVPGCRDVVIPGKSGLLVPARDAKALAVAIIELVRDPERVREMGAAAREDVVARFDTNVVNAVVIAAYEEALAVRGLSIQPKAAQLDAA
jgi:glycosyltransferase involved in cell wall biosynthesis